MDAKQITEIVRTIKNLKDRNQRVLQMQPLGEHIMRFPHFQKIFKEHPDSYNPLMFMNFLLRLSFHEYKPHKSVWEYNDIVSGIFIILIGEVKIYQPPNKNLLIKESPNIVNENNIIENVSSSINKVVKHNRKCITEINNYRGNFNINLNESCNDINNKKRKSQRNAVVSNILFPKLNKDNNYIALTTDNLNNKFDVNYSRRSSSHLISILREEDYEYLLKRTQYIELKENKKLDYIVNQGNVIGEDCLLKNIRYRYYAAETNTKCVFAFLRKKDYHFLFDKINESNKSKLKGFLYCLRYFNNRNNFIDKFYETITIKNFNKGHYIYKQNDPFKTFYIIKEGSVNLSIVQKEKIKSKINPEVYIKNSYIKKERFTSEKKYEIKGEYFINKKYNLVNLGVGEIFGDIEYYGGYKNYLYSARCNENVELLEIDIESYKKIQSKSSISFLDKKIKKQIQFLFKRINEKDDIEMKCERKNFKINNKFLKLILENNKGNKEGSRFINCYVNPFPIKKKPRCNILHNTRISPPSSFDRRKFMDSSNDENNFNSYNSNSYGTFITNVKNYIKLFYKNKQRYNENDSLMENQGRKKHIKITEEKVFKALTPKVKVWEKNFLDPTKRKKELSEDQRNKKKSNTFINKNIQPKKSNFKISSLRMSSTKEKKITFADKTYNIDKNNINDPNNNNNDKNSSNKTNDDNTIKKYSSKKLVFNLSKSNKTIIHSKFKNEEKTSSLKNSKIMDNSSIFFDGYRVYVNSGKSMSVKELRELKKIEKLKKNINITNREKIQKIFKIGKYSLGPEANGYL